MSLKWSDKLRMSFGGSNFSKFTLKVYIGQQKYSYPGQLFETDAGYVLQCTGCGALSELTPFRWKALESVVECSCLW